MSRISSLIQTFESKMEAVLKADRPALDKLAASLHVENVAVGHCTDADLRGFCIRRLAIDLAYDARRDAREEEPERWDGMS